MADKTVKELADMTKKSVDAIKKQLVDAGLPARGDDDIVTEQEQEKFVSFLQQSHGQQDKPRISINRKTTSTAKVTGTSGKAKNVNVEVRKKVVFEKPNPEKIAQELEAQKQAAELAAQKKREKAEQEAREKAQKEQYKREA